MTSATQAQQVSPGGVLPRRMERALVALLAAAAAWVCLSGNLGSEFWWNDAARHAMDGVFVLDCVRDLPGSLSLYRYATEYYARYPCLGLIQYPPFFPVVEALFFAVLGVSMETARLTVAACAALGAVFGYLVARRFVGRWGGMVFVLLFITAPGVVYWSRDVMLEMPVMAMMLASTHFFLGYVEDGRRKFGVAAAVLLALAILTKQTAVCLCPAWAAYALWRRGRSILRKTETWVAIGAGATLLLPFAVATVMYSPVNVGQTVGDLSAGVVNSRFSVASVLYYLQHLPGQVGAMCLAGIGALIAGAALRWSAGQPARGRSAGRRGAGYAALWIAGCYVLLTFVVVHKEPRFILIWVPGLALLGASGFARLAEERKVGRWATVAVTAMLGGQLAACGAGWRHDPWALAAPYVSGTAEVARQLAASPPGTVVFYSGQLNGNFIFHMRRSDPGRNVVVLRDSKLLFSVATIRAFGGETIHAGTQDEILGILRDYGVRYVVLEEPQPHIEDGGQCPGKKHGLERVLNALRGLLLRSGHLEERQGHPVAVRGVPGPERCRVFEFRKMEPARAETLRIDVPASGRVIEIPLERLGVQTAASLARRAGGG